MNVRWHFRKKKMKKQIFIAILTLVLFIQCKENMNKKTVTVEQIFAENNYDFGGSMKLYFYSDNRYSFIVFNQRPDYEKTEKFSGYYSQKKDTIYFEPFQFSYNNTTKAVIKNNFIEFIDGESPLKVEIKRNKNKTKSNLDFYKFEDYAIFTFDRKFYSSTYYHYIPNTIKPYDLKQNELVEIDVLLKKCFSENSDKLRKFDNYIIQCIAVINSKGEKEIWVYCHCKEPFINHTYKYSIIHADDGGKCNINLRLNLAKKKYSELNIAGEA